MSKTTWTTYYFANGYVSSVRGKLSARELRQLEAENGAVVRVVRD